MSAPPQAPAPPRSLTNRSRLPRRELGQKSFALEYTGAPRFCGGPQRASRLSRCATQMSLPPRPPGRLDAMYRLSPSGDWIGQPSLNCVFSSELVPATDSAFTGVAHGVKCMAVATPVSAANTTTAPTVAAARTVVERCIEPPFG